MKVRNKFTMLIALLSITLTACGGLSVGPSGESIEAPGESIEAPAATDIRASLIIGNPYCMVDDTWSTAIMPACIVDRVTDVTYALSVPDWLTFNDTDRTVSIVAGAAVPETPVSVTYLCCGRSEVSDEILCASREFVINDCDGGGVTDPDEIANSEVSLINSSSGFIDPLTVFTIDIYRPAYSDRDGRKVPTGIMVTNTGMVVTSAADDTGDLDLDGISNLLEITNNTNLFIYTPDPLPDPATASFASNGYTNASGVWGIAAADFNNDGRADLAVSSVDGRVAIYLRNDTGTAFENPIYNNLGLPDFLSELVAADFNSDGNMDVAGIEEFSTQFVVTVGDGSGGLTVHQNVLVGASPTAIATADFNGDTNVDIAILFNANLFIYIWNAATSQFDNLYTYATGVSPRDITIGDYNNDNVLDIIVANNGNQNLSFFRGHGDGQFDAGVTIPSGGEVLCLTSADFDRDGNLDVAIGTQTANSGVRIVLGNGDGTFGASIIYATTGSSRDIASADFDGDSYPDLVVANPNARVDMWMNNYRNTSDVEFNVVQNGFVIGLIPFALAVADFNNDGRIDTATATSVAPPGDLLFIHMNQ